MIPQAWVHGPTADGSVRLEEFWRNLEESRGICERKTLFPMKKEADQAGFKGKVPD